MTTKKQKVLVLGLDGASLEPIKCWASEGKLPNFQKIIENGVSAKLKSVIPPLTPVAWTSFMTGKNPGKHGIFGFTGKNADIVNSSDIHGKSIWSILSEENKKVVVMNVPITFPVEKVNGIMISGWMSPPNDLYTYPPEIRQKLKKRFPFYRVYMRENDPLGRNEKAADAWLEDLYSITKENADVMIHFLEEFEWDFFMNVLSGTDWISHVFFRYSDPACHGYDMEMAKKYRNAILRYYQEIDSILKKILDLIDEDVILIIMSDHGSSPFYDVFYLQEWLMKNGLLRLKERYPWETGFWLDGMGISLEKLALFLSTHPRLLRLCRWIWNALPVDLSTARRIDWSRTKAYPAENGIFINLKSREPEGIVKWGKEYENLRDFVMKKLSTYRESKSGKEIFEIFKKEEIYSGSYMGEAPDVVFLANGPYLISKGVAVPRRIIRFAMNFLPMSLQSAKHDLYGTLIIKGRDIKKGEILNESSIMDLAPTILHILGVSIPSDMDGCPLKEVFEPSSDLAKSNIKYVASESRKKEEHRLSKHDMEDIKKRLKALGYLN